MKQTAALQPMTEMSELRLAARPGFASNRATSLKGSTLAHGVHTSWKLVRIAFALFALPTTGCLIHPDLQVDNQDAGVNSPPAILGVRTDDQELPEPGPVIFDRGTGMFNAELIDTDVDDTLFVRVFVDYTIDSPTAPRVSCTAPPNGKPDRTVTCNTNALCLQADTLKTVPLNMHVVVFDREPLESGDPPFQAMPTGGLSTGRFYFLTCMEPM